MKTCNTCKNEQSLNQFHRNRQSSDGLDYYCKTCKYEKHRKRYVDNPFRTHITNKRSECAKKNLPFDLDEEYLRSIWTGFCPITGEPLSLANTMDSRESTANLDRTKPELGYVKGNVTYLSARINRIKNNATIKELRAIADWLENQERATTITYTQVGGNGEPDESQ